METNDIIVRRLPKRFRPYFVIGASVVIQFTNGLMYTFGNILPYLVSYLRWKIDPNQDRGSLLWLQSMMTGLPFSMLAGGYLEKRLGARLGALIGTSLYSGGIALSYFTIQMGLPWLILSLGLCSSMGMGISYNCVLIQSQRWLPKRIGLVSGLIAAGFGSTAFLISPLQTKFINPHNLPANSDGYFTQAELLERVPKMFLLLGGLFAKIQFFALFFIAEPLQQKSTQGYLRTGTDAEEPCLRNGTVTTTMTTSNHLEDCGEPSDDSSDNDNRKFISPKARQAGSLTEKQALLSTTFFFVAATFMCNGVWVQTISGFYKAFGQTFIKDDFFLSTIISFAAAANCLSRVLWGIITDKTSYQTSMLLSCALGVFLMWTLWLIKAINIPMLFFVWVCIMFTCVGATFTLIPYAVHRCFGSSNFGILYGFTQLGMSMGGIITALSAQFLLPHIGLERLFTFAGTMMLISLIISLFIHQTRYGRPVAARLCSGGTDGQQPTAKNGSAHQPPTIEITTPTTANGDSLS